MGILDLFRRDKSGLLIRCAMCKVHTTYPLTQRNEFVVHSCDADILVRERDESADEAALDHFVKAYEKGPPESDDLVALRDRLLYETGEGAIPGLEDLLYRIKYELGEPWPFSEISRRVADVKAIPLRIDWGNELEMVLHRMKKFAITQRQFTSVAPSARPILADKLARLKKEPLVPLEED